MNKKQRLKRLFATVFLSVLMLVPTFGASVGDELLEPEDGWQRLYFPNNTYYSGDIADHPNNGFCWAKGKGNEFWRTSKANQEFKFKFKGTQLRLIGASGNFAKDNIISIDGITETFSQYRDTEIRRGYPYALNYEVANLENKVHEVVITSGHRQGTTSIQLRGFEIR